MILMKEAASAVQNPDESYLGCNNHEYNFEADTQSAFDSRENIIKQFPT